MEFVRTLLTTFEIRLHSPQNERRVVDFRLEESMYKRQSQERANGARSCHNNGPQAQNTKIFYGLV